jgi:hypothetical protein
MPGSTERSNLGFQTKIRREYRTISHAGTYLAYPIFLDIIIQC